MISAAVEYIAAGGNRHPSAADWAPGVLAFGAGNNIALWNPDDDGLRGISALLAGHNDTVNAIKIWDHASRRIIISGSADKTIRFWSADEQENPAFHETQCLAEHAGSIDALAILPEEGIFISGAADGTVKVWRFDESQAILQQSIILKPRYFPLALALTTLPSGDILLAVAGTSNMIQLFVRPKPSQGFELQASLSGHEGWVRALDFTRESQSVDGDILLASASQDKYIRLWRVRQGASRTLDMSSAKDDLSVLVEKKSLSNKAYEVGSAGCKCQVTFEALLIGHEDWVYTARWAPKDSKDSLPSLLSASADNSLAIWHAESASGLWVCSSRLGEISSQKGSTTATGSTGGFWIGLWQPQGRSIVSHGRTGSWRRWTYQPASGFWVQQVGISGHVQEVQGLAWAPSGDYLLSTASDQTTRLSAPWRRSATSSWHEISRPQIHGYDLNCLDTLSDHRFVSGADEKLLRVFNKPKAVDTLISGLGGLRTSTAKDLPETANIPVLGLSNKAVDEEDGVDCQGDPQGQEPLLTLPKPVLDLDRPPLEDDLARHTLWPEHEKLYGHGYEISAVAASRDGSLVATACKASSIDHAVIRLYETREWREVKPPLNAHSLTVTGLSFSQDDGYLLSVGRDRQWAIFRRSIESPNTYVLNASNAKGHSRMILGCSWAPLVSSGAFFATAGRDKSVKIWKLNGTAAELATTISTGASTTAIDFHIEAVGEQVLLAYGNEDGKIGVLSLDPRSFQVQAQVTLGAAVAPSRTVNALRWRPIKDSVPQLAVASDDHSVRILQVYR